MLTFEKVLTVFADYLQQDPLYEVVIAVVGKLDGCTKTDGLEVLYHFFDQKSILLPISSCKQLLSNLKSILNPQKIARR